jgi:hypothetical protein
VSTSNRLCSPDVHIQTVCARQFRRTRIDTRVPLTSLTPRALRSAPRRSKPRSTTSTSIKEVTNSPPSSTTPLKNMVNSLGRSSAEPASLTPSGTSPIQSHPSSWPPRNTFPARSPVTLTMMMTLLRVRYEVRQVRSLSLSRSMRIWLYAVRRDLLLEDLRVARMTDRKTLSMVRAPSTQKLCGYCLLCQSGC